MSRAEFQDDCPGCQPAMVDPRTGKVLPADDPVMVAAMAVWEDMSKDERQAFHRVTCLNSRAPWDLQAMRDIAAKIARRATAS